MSLNLSNPQVISLISKKKLLIGISIESGVSFIALRFYNYWCKLAEKQKNKNFKMDMFS